MLDALKSPDPAAVARAADAVTSKVSPWQAALAVAREGHSIRIFSPVRPTGRPANSAGTEAAALAALDRVDAMPPSPASFHARARVLVLLAEVAGDAGAARLRLELDRSPTMGGALPVMRALETVYGLPAFYEPHALGCGEPGPPDVTRKIHERHRAEETRRFTAGRASLLAWLDANASLSRRQRVAAAFTEWDARQWIAQPDLAPEGIEFSTVLRFAAVLRLGDDAVAELRARKASAHDDNEAARYEILTAAITGTLDKAFVRRLLNAGESQLQIAAIEIIGAAGDASWVTELDARQRSTMDDVAQAASTALFTLLGRRALPLLRAAAEANPDNLAAKYAAMELAGER